MGEGGEKRGNGNGKWKAGRGSGTPTFVRKLRAWVEAYPTACTGKFADLPVERTEYWATSVKALLPTPGECSWNNNNFNKQHTRRWLKNETAGLYRYRPNIFLYDTIRDAILTCVQKLTRVSLIYRTKPTTKKYKTEKLKSKERIWSEVSVNSPWNPWS